MPELVLITTSDCEGNRAAELARMTASVEQFRTAMPEVTVRLYLLLQRYSAEFRGEIPAWVTLITESSRLSLSAARNRMISRVLADGINDDAIVAFPDDDAWYPEHTLAFIVGAFVQYPTCDFWFCRYGSQPSSPVQQTSKRAVEPRVQQVISFASSNTLVIRGRVLKAVGNFDEALGVGTPAGGGEDTDYALRAYFEARRVVFVPEKIIGHRDGNSVLRARYYRSSLAVIASHANRAWVVRLAYWRKLLVGVWLTMTGRLSLVRPGHPRRS